MASDVFIKKKLPSLSRKKKLNYCNSPRRVTHTARIVQQLKQDISEKCVKVTFLVIDTDSNYIAQSSLFRVDSVSQAMPTLIIQNINGSSYSFLY